MIIRSKAPLRLGFAGGGSDVSPYCDTYGGAVLNATISMYAYCTIIPCEDDIIHFHATDLNESLETTSKSKINIKDKLKLHIGVYNYIIENFNNRNPLSFKMSTYSDAPIGSGLGSSSTLVVTMVKAYMEWLQLPLGDYDLAHISYLIERKYLGLEGGKQDQYAAAFGGFNYIEFFKDDIVIVNPLHLKEWIKNELQSSLILLFTGQSRVSSRIISEQINNSIIKNPSSLEGMCELKKCAGIMKKALLSGDLNTLAQTLTKGWIAKKKTAISITNKQINQLYDFVMLNGGKGAKISGAGGGGIMTVLCNPDQRQELIIKLRNLGFQTATPDFISQGAQSWVLY